MNFSLELQILVWGGLRAPGWNHRIAELVSDVPDWERLVWLAQRHHMSPLLYHAFQQDPAAGRGTLTQLPPHLLEVLSREVRASRARAARQQQDTRRVLAAFRRAGIRALVLKGLPLAHRLYGDATLRQANDIDLLVRPKDRAVACGILQQQGFRSVSGALASPGMQWYLRRFATQVGFVHPVRGTKVELMWALHQQCASPPDSLFNHAYEGAEIPRLPPFQEALDLLAHGAKHNWDRLKWLTDLWRAWECYDIDWQDWLRAVDEAGLQPSLNSALWLHGALVPEHPLPGELAGQEPGRRGLLMARRACRELEAVDLPPKDQRRLFQRLSGMGSSLSACTPAHRNRQLRSGFIGPVDVARFPLPAWACGLYPLLKPVTWPLRKLEALRGGHREGMAGGEFPRAAVSVTNEPGEDKCRYYRLFGLQVTSDIDLPLIQAHDDAPADLSITLGTGFSNQAENTQAWMLNIPATGTVRVSNERSILIDPAPGAGHHHLQLWLLGSALGAVCWRRGWLPLHATAVRFGEQVVLLAGPSGAGKSTLAAACLARGAELVCDDLTPLSLGPRGPCIPGPGPRRLKLWEDAAGRFAPNAPRRGLVEEGANKWELAVPEIEDRPFPVAALLWLDDASSPGDFRPLYGAKALQALSEHLYRGSLLPEAERQETLQSLAALPRWINVLRVGRPPDLDGVAELADKIDKGGFQDSPRTSGAVARSADGLAGGEDSVPGGEPHPVGGVNLLCEESRLARRRDRPAQLLQGDLVILNPDWGEYQVLRGTGRRAWELLDRAGTLKGLCSLLAAEYGITPEQCRADVVPFLEELHGLGLLEVSPC